VPLAPRAVPSPLSILRRLFRPHVTYLKLPAPWLLYNNQTYCQKYLFTPCIFVNFYINKKYYKKIITNLQEGTELFWVIMQRVMVMPRSVTIIWYKSLILKKPYSVPQIGRCIWHSTVILLYDIIQNMTFYSGPIVHNMTLSSDPTVRHYTQCDILQWSYCATLYTIWHCTVILLYDIIYTIWHSAVTKMYDIIYTIWHSTCNPTIRHYTQYGIAQ
jgi:hypothetical protein